MEKTYAIKEANVGDFRKFSFSKEDYEVKEIINEPEISIDIIWNTGICPHCKVKIERTINHKFSKIEILEKENIKDGKKEDLVIIGDTTDGRKLRISVENFDMVLAKSKIYNKLISEVK